MIRCLLLLLLLQIQCGTVVTNVCESKFNHYYRMCQSRVYNLVMNFLQLPSTHHCYLLLSKIGVRYGRWCSCYFENTEYEVIMVCLLSVLD
jgi:hypothetical protein